MEISINYVAVLIAAIAGFCVGGVWYGFLFREQWMKLMGHTEESTTDTGMAANKAYAIQFIATLVMAYVLAHGVIFSNTYLETGGALAGATTGFWYWIGFVVPVSLGIVLWEGKPWKLWLINASHYLAALLVMGAILGMWM